MTPRSRLARWRILCAAVVLLAAVAASIAAAPPAAAHATVVSTNPTDGQVLPQSPETVQIQFNEQVSITVGGLTVLSSDGVVVSEGRGEVVSGGELLMTKVPEDLPDGGYVANYRVVSADGHPVNGAIVFGIGDGTVIDASIRDLAVSSDPTFEVAAAVARFVTYGGALLAAGLAAFAVFAHDQRPDRRAVDRSTRWASGGAVIAMLAWIGCQAALTSGDGLAASIDPTTLEKSLGDGLGSQTMILLLGLAACNVAVRGRRTTYRQVFAFYGCLAVGFSFVLWGHAKEAPNTWIAQGADAVHVVAAAVWFGGLVGLAVTLRARQRLGRADDPDRPSGGAEGLVLSTAEVVVRFSTTAAVAVTALVVAGVLVAWQEVGSLHALVSTTYGRLVLAKVGAVGIVVALAAVNRYRLVPAVARAGLAAAEGEDASLLPGPDARRAWKQLAGIVWLEAIVIVGVLAVTAVLVNVTPARSTAGGPALFEQTIAQGDIEVNLIVVPAGVGRNSMHIQYRDAAGKPVATIRSARVALSLPEQDLGPLDVDLLDGGPGHYLAEAATFPVAGTWEVAITARVSDFESTTTTFLVKVR